MFIKAILKNSQKVKRIRNYVSKCSLYLYLFNIVKFADFWLKNADVSRTHGVCHVIHITFGSSLGNVWLPSFVSFLSLPHTREQPRKDASWIGWKKLLKSVPTKVLNTKFQINQKHLKCGTKVALFGQFLGRNFTKFLAFLKSTLSKLWNCKVSSKVKKL